ncbi:MAG: 50S ribosomal protein L30 [candidate division Zixibacteria bacterium 4484_93]|nr:MAG: 50S ribosomal protein L30 [candidate division Zixibacteria bacterium 4484_93]
MKQIRITQIRSSIGHPREQKRTLRALGIKKMHHSVVKESSPEILGMVRKIAHLVRVEKIGEENETQT